MNFPQFILSVTAASALSFVAITQPAQAGLLDDCINALIGAPPSKPTPTPTPTSTFTPMPVAKPTPTPTPKNTPSSSYFTYSSTSSSSSSSYSFSRDITPLLEAALGSSPVGELHRDFLLARLVKEIIGFKRSYSVSLGEPGQPLKLEERAIYGEWITRILKEHGGVVFDADSAGAELFIERGESCEACVGVTAFPERANLDGTPPIVWIKNDFARMQLYKQMDRGITAPRSPMGVALALVDKLHNVLDPRGEWVNGVEAWVKSSGDYDLGIKWVGRAIPASIDPIRLNTAVGGEHRGRLPIKSKWLDSKMDLSYFSVEDALKDAKNLLEGIEALESHGGAGGVVVFGSSKYLPARMTQDLYGAVKALASDGIPITTGGSGGTMEIANTAAFDAGGVSVGISITHGSKPKNEEGTPTAVHTLTVGATDYETRIPLLLHKRAFALIAAGGTGTLKEISTTIVANLASTQPMPIVFFGRAYWQPLYDWMKQQLTGMPVFLVDDQDELMMLVKQMRREGLISDERLAAKGKPTPRNDRTEFRIPAPKPNPAPPVHSGSWLKKDDKKKDGKKKDEEEDDDDDDQLAIWGLI